MIWRIIKLDGENVFEIILGALFYVLPVGLIASIVVNPAGFSDFATKVPPIKSIMCSSLKSEIEANDEIGRELWNAYQAEVSSLADIGSGADGYFEYQKKIKNVARRANQVLINANTSFTIMNNKKYCVFNSMEIQKAIDATSRSIKDTEAVLDGRITNWNNDFYSVYYRLSMFLK